MTLPGTHRRGLLGCDGEERGVEDPWVLSHEVRIMARELSKLQGKMISDLQSRCKMTNLGNIHRIWVLRSIVIEDICSRAISWPSPLDIGPLLQDVP